MVSAGPVGLGYVGVAVLWTTWFQAGFTGTSPGVSDVVVLELCTVIVLELSAEAVLGALAEMMVGTFMTLLQNGTRFRRLSRGLSTVVMLVIVTVAV